VFVCDGSHVSRRWRLDLRLPLHGRHDWIRKAVDDGTIRTRKKLNGTVDLLLGGWSLGGFLSLEVAYALARDPKINVAGIVMIDSSYGDDDATEENGFCPVEFDEDGKTRNEILCHRTMMEAVRMLEGWEAPRWTGDLAGKRPKSILIKCRDHVPTSTGQVSCADAKRDEDALGWSEYDPKMFHKVLEIPGNHFNIFERKMLDKTSRAIQQAFDKLTTPNARQRMLAELQCM
jgi:thioesterase domain-containing protein